MFSFSFLEIDFPFFRVHWKFGLSFFDFDSLIIFVSPGLFLFVKSEGILMMF